MTIFSTNLNQNSVILEKQMIASDHSDPKLSRLNVSTSEGNQADDKLIHMAISSKRPVDQSKMEQELEKLYHANIFGSENSGGNSMNTHNHKLLVSGDGLDRWMSNVDYLDNAINQLNLENDLGVTKGGYTKKSHLEYDNVCDSLRSMNGKKFFGVEGPNSTPKPLNSESDKYIPLLMSGSTIATAQSATSSPCEITESIELIDNCASIDSSFLPGIDYYRGDHSKFSGMNTNFVSGMPSNIGSTDKHTNNQGKLDHSNSMAYLNEIFSSVSNTISQLSNIELSNSNDLPRFNNSCSNASLLNMAMQQSPDLKTVESHLNGMGSCVYDDECNLWFGNHTTPKKDSHVMLSNNYSFNGLNSGTINAGKTYKSSKHLGVEGLNCQLGNQFGNQKSCNNYTEQDEVIGMITPISSRNSSNASVPSESIMIAKEIADKLVKEIGCNGDAPDIDRIFEVLCISLNLLGCSNLDNALLMGNYQNFCLSQLCLGVGGPNFAAPTMLAHPDEFKNPSSFLKIYGDPLCCTVKGKGSSNINNATSHNPAKGQNGNWVCVKCSNVNFPRRFRCFKCNECRDESGDRIVGEYAKQVYLHHLRAYRSLSKQNTQASGTNSLVVAANGDSNNQINMLSSKQRTSQSGNSSLLSNSNLSHSLGTRKHNLSPTSPSFFPMNGKVYMRSSSENFASHLVNLPPPPPPPPDGLGKLGYKQLNFSNRVRDNIVQVSSDVFLRRNWKPLQS